jgi:Carbohydrate binding module (family 6)
MTTSPTRPPGVYRSRSSTTRRRVLTVAAALALVLLGYLIGRLQGFGTPASGSAVQPVASAAAPSAVPAPSSAAPEPASEAPTTTPPAGVDAYAALQAEAADAQQGTQTEDTTDTGGGKNVGWIAGGDWLRFDDVNFGDTPAGKLIARVSSDSDDGGRMEIRVDTLSNPPVASLQVNDTGGWQDWATATTTMTPVSGVHTVFVTFAGDGDDEFMNLNYFAFEH